MATRNFTAETQGALEPIKCTLKKFGTFSTPTFGGVGEPFKDGRQRARAEKRLFPRSNSEKAPNA